MTSEAGSNPIWDPLVEVLVDPQTDLRMQALHLISEGYGESPRVLRLVWKMWDDLGASAFPEFPMLSFLPIDASDTKEALERAAQMAVGRKLTDPIARCAGKMVEQVVRLQPQELKDHLALIESTKAKSKIFFRVDITHLRERIELLPYSANQVAAVLDDAVQNLASKPESPHLLARGLAALEALRLQHPEYIDLASVLANVPSSDGSSSHAQSSFQLVLASLVQFSHSSTEWRLGQLLLSDQEAIYTSAVEALVRAGTREAAEELLARLDEAPPDNQKWIARGLQRLRFPGLASGIAACRDHAQDDPPLWLMLLIAEVRQLEPKSLDRLAFDLARLRSPSESLIAALFLYLRVVRDAVTNIADLKTVIQQYLAYCNHPAQERLQDS